MIGYNKIILIDDENICNYITSKILEKADIALSIEPYLNARKALTDIIKSGAAHSPEVKNLILLDLNMPGMNGWEFLDAFEKLPAAIVDQYCVMMLSSSIDSRDIAKSKTYKCVQKFISKPFSVDKITG